MLAGLRWHYAEICAGLGLHKSPELYGAFPTDPYSHTPAFAGVQQPGMTGQVKEDILARAAELGLVVENGQLSFVAELVGAGEFCQQEGQLASLDLQGACALLPVPAGSFGLHVCQVPVIVHRDGPAHIALSLRDGSQRRRDGLVLDPQSSGEIFARTGTVTRLDVYLGWQPCS